MVSCCTSVHRVQALRATFCKRCGSFGFTTCATGFACFQHICSPALTATFAGCGDASLPLARQAAKPPCHAAFFLAGINQPVQLGDIRTGSTLLHMAAAHGWTRLADALVAAGGRAMHEASGYSMPLRTGVAACASHVHVAAQSQHLLAGSSSPYSHALHLPPILVQAPTCPLATATSCSRCTLPS